MATIYELFGYPTQDKSPEVEASRQMCRCPFTEARCDGGGNRHQTTITLQKHPELANYFNEGFTKVIPGICSIQSPTGGAWIVCPRRLFGIKSDVTGLPPVNQSLQDHKVALLKVVGLPSDRKIGIWSEVYLRFAKPAQSDALESELSADAELITDEQAIDAPTDSDINYHFDYVVAELEQLTLHDIAEKYDGNERDLTVLLALARKSKLVSGRDVFTQLLWVPNLKAPFFILEVMTASTSGSNTNRGTNISAAFTDAILGRPHESPGINKRQVWARMSSQLFAKSALAEMWGGKTFWIVQDELLRYVELTTLLNVSKVSPNPRQTINFVSMRYDPLTTDVAFNQLYQGDAGIAFSNPSNTFTDLLLPKIVPSKMELVKAILRRSYAGIIDFREI